MAIKHVYPIDELELSALLDSGWAQFTLWFSDTPEGPYALAAATFEPATLQDASDGEVYNFTILATTPTPGQWFKIRAFDGVSTYSDLSAAKPFHGGGGTTFTALRRMTGILTGDMVLFEATSNGSTTTAVSNTLAALRAPDNYFEGFMFYNALRDERAYCSGSVRTAGSAAKVTLTVEPAITSTTAGDMIELTKRWTPDDYRDAINWALKDAYPVLHRSIVNTGLRTGEELHQLYIPQDIRKVNKIEIESENNADSPDGGSRGHPWREEPFEVIRDGLVQFAEFKRELKTRAGITYRVRIRGTGSLSPIYNNSEYTEVGMPEAELVAALAASRLWGSMPGAASSSDREFYKERSQYYLGMYNELKDALARGKPPGKIWSQEARWGNVR